MGTQLFAKPVPIFVGVGMPAMVSSAAEAFALLTDWPGYRVYPEYRLAKNACQAALAGEVNAETARATFVEFARRRSILISVAEPAVAASVQAAAAISAEGRA